MLSLLGSSHGSKSAGHPQEQPLRMPDNSLSPGGRESREFEEGGKKKSRKSERGQGKLQIEEGKVMVFKHRSSGN